VKTPIALITALTTVLFLVCGAATAVLGGATFLDACTAPSDSPSGGERPSHTAAAHQTAITPCPAGTWTQPVHAPIVSGFRTAERPHPQWRRPGRISLHTHPRRLGRNRHRRPL